tara:strand:+ start:2966 stop:3793 length:828 start_codon:yes stop_codon:yes gene_type:complete
MDHCYRVHSAKRVVMAAVLLALVSIGVSWAAYDVTLNVLITTAAFAVSSLLMVNVAMFAIVPPTHKLADSKALIFAALKDPKRIKSAGKNEVALVDGQGRVRGLSGFEQALWGNLIIPYLIKNGSRSGAASTETDVMKQRRAELSALEQQLLAEREKLKEERAVLETRTDELTQQGAQLKAQELALASLQQEFADDRDQFEAKKTELEQMQGSLQCAQAPAGNHATDLEQRESELEERLCYVATVENDLIERLNRLSEREASVEQTEVEAGLRKD